MHIIRYFIVRYLRDCQRLVDPPSPPPPPPPPLKDHVPLHSNSLSKNMARALGVANNTHPLSWGEGGGGTNGKDPIFYTNRPRHRI